MTHKTAIPELIEKRAGSAWRHTPPPLTAGAPTASRTNRTVAYDHHDDPTAHAQRLAALIGSRYNSRRDKQLAAAVAAYANAQLKPSTLALFHAAQELRNRLLAHATTVGAKLPPQRYYLPEQLAAHHATARPEQLGADYALQLAALIHHPTDLAAYLHALKHKHHAENLAKHAHSTAEAIKRHLSALTDDLRNKPKARETLKNYATGEHYKITLAEMNAVRLTHYLLSAADNAPRQAKHDQQARRRKAAKERATERLTAGNRKPPDAQLSDSWHSVVFDKPPREITHTGRLGRRRIATNAGKNPNRIHNYAGDPMRRIFTRNTRGTNALVIVDCSGSMSLSTDDLAAIMSASAGATVIAYSAGDSHNPNTYLLAHNGRRVRQLPDFHGNNGNDAPAASYAINNYRKTGAPVLWITDGQATGKGDATNRELRAECRQLAAKHGAIISHNVQTALADLALIRAGKRPPQRLNTFHR